MDKKAAKYKAYLLFGSDDESTDPAESPEPAEIPATAASDNFVKPAQPAKPAVTIDLAATAQLPGPIAFANFVKPAEPAKPAIPTVHAVRAGLPKPTASGNLVERAQPAHPAEPAQPAGLDASINIAELVDLSEPVKPAVANNLVFDELGDVFYDSTPPCPPPSTETDSSSSRTSDPDRHTSVLAYIINDILIPAINNITALLDKAGGGGRRRGSGKGRHSGGSNRRGRGRGIRYLCIRRGVVARPAFSSATTSSGASTSMASSGVSAVNPSSAEKGCNKEKTSKVRFASASAGQVKSGNAADTSAKRESKKQSDGAPQTDTSKTFKEVPSSAPTQKWYPQDKNGKCSLAPGDPGAPTYAVVASRYTIVDPAARSVIPTYVYPSSFCRGKAASSSTKSGKAPDADAIRWGGYAQQLLGVLAEIQINYVYNSPPVGQSATAEMYDMIAASGKLDIRARALSFLLMAIAKIPNIKDFDVVRISIPIYDKNRKRGSEGAKTRDVGCMTDPLPEFDEEEAPGEIPYDPLLTDPDDDDD